MLTHIYTYTQNVFPQTLKFIIMHKTYTHMKCIHSLSLSLSLSFFLSLSHTHTHTNAHTYTHTRAHTHKHTYICKYIHTKASIHTQNLPVPKMYPNTHTLPYTRIFMKFTRTYVLYIHPYTQFEHM